MDMHHYGQAPCTFATLEVMAPLPMSTTCGSMMQGESDHSPMSAAVAAIKTEWDPTYLDDGSFRSRSYTWPSQRPDLLKDDANSGASDITNEEGLSPGSADLNVPACGSSTSGLSPTSVNFGNNQAGAEASVGIPVPSLPGQQGQSQSANGKTKNTARRNAWGNMSYADLITMAIESSSDKRLTLSQIYDWMVKNIRYFRDKGDSNSSAGWKNSIRHNLSLHNRFMRVQNEGTGKSSWWVINPDAKPGKSSRRRATSMDTKVFEKKRGRVKKRLEELKMHGILNSTSRSVLSHSPTNSEDSFPPTELDTYNNFQLSPGGEFRARASSNTSSCGRLSPVLTFAGSDLHENQVPSMSPIPWGQYEPYSGPAEMDTLDEEINNLDLNSSLEQQLQHSSTSPSQYGPSKLLISHPPSSNSFSPGDRNVPASPQGAVLSTGVGFNGGRVQSLSPNDSTMVTCASTHNSQQFLPLVGSPQVALPQPLVHGGTTSILTNNNTLLSMVANPLGKQMHAHHIAQPPMYPLPCPPPYRGHHAPQSRSKQLPMPFTTSQAYIGQPSVVTSSSALPTTLQSSPSSLPPPHPCVYQVMPDFDSTLFDVNMQGGLECDVDQVISHELTMDGTLDFNFDNHSASNATNAAPPTSGTTLSSSTAPSMVH